MAIEMIDEIKEIKNKNGNIDLCQKDLTWYLITKTGKDYDKLSTKLDKLYDKLDHKVGKKTFYAMMSLLSSILIVLIVMTVSARP